MVPRLLLLLIAAALSGCGGECLDDRQFYEQKVWGQVMSRVCVKCHTTEGTAAEANAKLLLLTSAYPAFLDANYASTVEVARIQYDGTSELLLKPIGKAGHGGGAQIAENGPEHNILKEMVERVAHPVTSCGGQPASVTGEVTLLDPLATLRRATLHLASRLPKPEEIDRVRQGGEAALDPILDEVMREEAFLVRLKEIWNDVLLTNRYQSGALNLLADADWPGKYWYNPQRVADDMLSDEQRKQRAYSELGVASEPLELIAHIARNDRPFSEVVSAPYTVVNPYSARTYGLDPAQLGFTDLYAPYQFREARLAIRRNGMDLPLPHAGLLTQTVFLRRYPTTDTNLNRHRARMTFKFFLATDILKVAERPLDPSSVVSNNPTRDDAYCKVCHKVIDPVAGTFQKWDRDGRYMPELAWPTALPQPGLGASVIEDVRAYPKALSWLGDRITGDPRFVVATVGTVWRALTGREPLPYPPADAPDFADRVAAWRQQDAMLREVGEAFKKSNYNIKTIFRGLVRSPNFRAVAGNGPAGRLEGLGVGRLLTPELLTRRIAAVTGVRWTRSDRQEWLLNDYNLLYGGIDSSAVTERLVEPNGIMANLGLRMADEVSCLVTAWEFTRPAASRRLLPLVEVTDVPEDARGGALVESTARIRAGVQHLHAQLLGEVLPLDHPEIERTVQLFVKTHRELRDAKSTDLAYECQGRWDRETGAGLPANQVIDRDKHQTIRAWMAVMTYLLADWKFLHE